MIFWRNRSDLDWSETLFLHTWLGVYKYILACLSRLFYVKSLYMEFVYLLISVTVCHRPGWSLQFATVPSDPYRVPPTRVNPTVYHQSEWSLQGATDPGDPYSLPPTRVIPTVCHRPGWSLWFLVLMLMLDWTAVWNIARWRNFNYCINKLELHRD